MEEKEMEEPKQIEASAENVLVCECGNTEFAQATFILRIKDDKDDPSYGFARNFQRDIICLKCKREITPKVLSEMMTVAEKRDKENSKITIVKSTKNENTVLQ